MFEEFKVGVRIEIHNLLNGLRRSHEIEDEYEEVVEDLEVPKVEIHKEGEIFLQAMA